MNSPRDLCEAQCTKLCIDFANSVDACDYEKCVNLFAPDAVLDHVLGKFEGRKGIMEMLSGRARDIVTRHACTNVDITYVDEKNAVGKCYVILFRASADKNDLPVSAPAPMVVEYHDEYCYMDSKWLIKTRRTELVFR